MNFNISREKNGERLKGEITCPEVVFRDGGMIGL